VAKLSLKRVAIALILCGVTPYACFECWLATRKLVPLDIPVSLSRGHIRTPEFSINLDAVYYIAFEVEKTSAVGNLECLMRGCDETPAILSVKWTLSSGGQVESSGSTDFMYGSFGGAGTVECAAGWFASSGGRHRLDIDVLSDASILNTGSPRLKIEANRDRYDHLSRLSADLLFVSGMLVIVGGVMLLATRKRKAKQSTDLTIFAAPGAGQKGAGHLRKLPRSVLFSGLPPSFALLAVSLLLLVSVPVWNHEFWREPARGILVLTSAQSRMTPGYGQGSKPLTLRIDKERRWFFEDKPVSPEEFPAALRQALNRRPDWFVCVDADPALDVQLPARAMDTIQGLFAKIIVATPKAVDDGCTATGSR
jgi:biopolymer transport protein ExbD